MIFAHIFIYAMYKFQLSSKIFFQVLESTKEQSNTVKKQGKVVSASKVENQFVFVRCHQRLKFLSS